MIPSLTALSDCYCKIRDALADLQAQVDAIINTDDQQLSLVGNTLVLEDGGSVDLSPFLDNTDNQIITAFNLSPAGILTLTIEDGNTVTVDLSGLDTDTDQQTLTLAGTLLSISNGNTVDLSSIDTDVSAVTTSLTGTTLTTSVTEDGSTVADTVDLSSLVTPASTFSVQNTGADGETVSVTHNGIAYPIVHPSDSDDQILATSFVSNPCGVTTTEISISNGNTVPINHQCIQVQTKTIYAPVAHGRVNANGTPAFIAGATVASIGGGQYRVTHNLGTTDYTASLTSLEDTGNRDAGDIQIIDGSVTANTFDVMTTTGDNGPSADAFVNRNWHFQIFAECELLTAVLVDGTAAQVVP